MLQIRIFLFIFFSLNLLSSNSDTESKAHSRKEILKLTNEASKYLHEYNFEKSFISARLSLQYAISAKDNFLIAKSYNIIAANYENLSEFDKAIFYYKKGLDFANKTQNDTIKNWINNNLGNIYSFEKKEYDKGISFYKKSIKFSGNVVDTSQVFITKLNIAWAYFDTGNFKKGLPYLNFINKHYKKYGDKTAFVALNMLNGMYFGHINEHKKAKTFFDNAIKLGKEVNEKFDLANSYFEYSKYLLKIEDYKNAYANLELYNKITIELNNSLNLKRANIVGVNLELDEFKRKLDTIENENFLQDESLKKSRIIFIMFFIVLCILLILIYTLFKNNNFKKKTNAELTFTNEELIIAKEKAEEVSQLKSQFISTISHELRTPLYGVVGITNMILDEHKELAQSPHLSSLKLSAKYLLTLVNDVLQINKIDENRIVLESLAFNISDEIGMIKNSLSYIAKNNGNSININIDPAIPEFLVGDKLRLSQIIMNLVSNALKFTKNGKVDINVALVKSEKELYFIEFKIIDNGIGIETNDHDSIFENFVQVGRKDEDYQGTGLGLSIVKRLLGIFNSDISLESKIGVGTTFTFTIAFESVPFKTNNSINETQINLTAVKVYKILAVDDNRINQLVTKKILEKNNCDCIVVDSGYAALELLEIEKFDVILMDINMPLMNGFEATRRIRLKGVNTPIIALTAFDKEEIAEEAIAAGFNDIIIKPFEPEILFKSINHLVSKAQEPSLI